MAELHHENMLLNGYTLAATINVCRYLCKSYLVCVRMAEVVLFGRICTMKTCCCREDNGYTLAATINVCRYLLSVLIVSFLMVQQRNFFREPLGCP